MIDGLVVQHELGCLTARVQILLKAFFYEKEDSNGKICISKIWQLHLVVEMDAHFI